MRIILGGMMCLLVFATTLAAKADFTRQMQVGMTGSYYNPSTSGQGFNFEMLNTAPGQFIMLGYWYTKHPNPNYAPNSALNKIWVVAQGSIDIFRTTQTLPLYAVENGKFNTPTPGAVRNVRIGDLFIDVRSCEQINVAWNIYYPGQTFRDSIYENGSVGNLRLTPVQSIQTSNGVQRLCVNECITNSQGFVIGGPSACYQPRTTNLVQNKRLTADYNTGLPFAEISKVLDVSKASAKQAGLTEISDEMWAFLNSPSFAANRSALEAEQKLVRSLTDEEYAVYQKTEAAKAQKIISNLQTLGWPQVQTH